MEMTARPSFRHHSGIISGSFPEHFLDHFLFLWPFKDLLGRPLKDLLGLLDDLVLFWIIMVNLFLIIVY